MAGMAKEVDWRRQRFLEWLCTAHKDRMPTTQKELAAELVISADVLVNWKRQPEFLAEWERQYRLTVGNPGRAQHVLDELYETATDRSDPRQVQAAKAYLEAIDVVKPKKVDVTVTNGKAAKELTDDELFSMLAERAEVELMERENDRQP